MYQMHAALFRCSPLSPFSSRDLKDKMRETRDARARDGDCFPPISGVMYSIYG